MHTYISLLNVWILSSWLLAEVFSMFASVMARHEIDTNHDNDND